MDTETVETDLLGHPVSSYTSDRSKLTGVSTNIPQNIAKKLNQTRKHTKVSESKFHKACIVDFIHTYNQFDDSEKQDLLVYASPRRGSDSSTTKNVYLPQTDHQELKKIADSHGYRVSDLVLTALFHSIVPISSSSKKPAAA